MIYLDNSATTYPKPPNVIRAVNNSFSKFGANPGRGGYKMANDTATAIYNVREKLAEFFNAYNPEDVIFTKSCTEALNQVILGKLKAGDHVVISDLEHNAVLRAVKHMEKFGVNFNIFETTNDNDKTVDNLRSAINENTKLVVCTAASNVFGIRLPIKRLSALCKVYEIEICVDGAQGAGVIPLDIKNDEIDYLCIPAHKGLYALSGLGVLISNKAQNLEPLIYGGTGFNSNSPYLPGILPERFESGTVNSIGITALGAGVDFVKSKGENKIFEYEIGEISKIYTALSNMKNISLYTPFPTKENSVPVLSFNILNNDSEEIGQKLGNMNIAVRCGMHCAPLAHHKFNTQSGTVRVSPSVFTTKQEINLFINNVNKLQSN